MRHQVADEVNSGCPSTTFEIYPISPTVDRLPAYSPLSRRPGSCSGRVAESKRLHRHLPRILQIYPSASQRRLVSSPRHPLSFPRPTLLHTFLFSPRCKNVLFCPTYTLRFVFNLSHPSSLIYILCHASQSPVSCPFYICPPVDFL